MSRAFLRTSVAVLVLVASPSAARPAAPAGGSIVSTDSAAASALAPVESDPAAPVRGTRVADRIRKGFVETVIADSLDSPVSMAVAPDGRVFVCEQGGRLRIVKNDVPLARPFLVAPTRGEGEEGLLGVAFDPAFATNHWVYVCYTALEPRRHSVVVRYTAAGDVALPGSAVTIFSLDDDVDPIHVGGALKFGRDGRLYLGTGESGEGTLSQSLRSTHGKLLRIDRNGGIPADNPFAQMAEGRHAAIWARGFRNAWAFDVDRRTGRVFVNDVGGSGSEEIDDVVAGANYGWPAFEGPGGHADFRDPIHAYGHEHGCAITGGTFYDPPVPRLPREWVGRYLFAEYCENEIRWLDPAAPASTGVFGTTLAAGPVDLRVGPDGALYYLARGSSSPVGGDHSSWGIVVRVTPSPSAPRKPLPAPKSGE